MITVGTVVLAGYAGGLGVVTEVGKRYGAPGAWIMAATGDPGATTAYPVFAPDWTIKPAVVGETVCPLPLGEHFCGLAHVRATALATLPRAEVTA